MHINKLDLKFQIFVQRLSITKIVIKSQLNGDFFLSENNEENPELITLNVLFSSELVNYMGNSSLFGNGWKKACTR